ncbi:hypothetical protein AAZX31_18G268500 [Glycine max]
MADTIVVFLIEKLTRLLAEEAKLLGSAHDKVTSLRNELRFMNLFLNNSQGKRKDHNMVAELVDQIRDIAHEAEDVIDNYISDMIKQRRRNMLEKFGRGVDHALMLRNLTVKIDRIKTTINDIFDNKVKYGIEAGRRDSEEEAERIRKQRRDVEEQEVVGFAHDSKVVVIEKLMASGSRLKLVSIVGMGGLGPMPPYFLPFLTEEESWELLSNKVFRGEDCPSDLEPMGKLIAESCNGLPLAIIVMAGILANKKSLRDWSRIKDHVNWHLGRDTTLKDILKLSYDTLPARLKPCFLYFGMYPEDYKIPVKQLIQLWISEGLLTQETCGSSTNIPEPEYIAEEYLDELVDRSLIQVVSRTSDGGVKTCRIHDLLRDLCISESKEDKFFEVCGEVDFQIRDSCPRKLSLHGTLFHFSSSSAVSDYSITGTRSLLCFGQEVYKVKPNHWRWLLKSFRLARVLDLGRMNVNSIPNDLEKLIHLRYLRIHSYNIETIPASICRLWNLETLDLRGSPIKSFSGDLWQLKQLRHLLMFGPVGLPDMPSESKTMQNLQTLSTVALDPRTTSLLDSRRFPRLTKLGIHHERRDKCNARIQLQSLNRLSHLRKLKVIGTTEIPQNANVFPSNITKISLTKFGCFNSNAMHILGKLPSLQVLKLSSQTNDTRFDLHCATGGFLQLQVFEMIAIKVKNWRLDKGSMPRIRRLDVRSCKSLTELPKELWSLTSLREVQVLWPCTELVKRLQNLVVNNGCKLVVYPLSTNDELDFL